MVLHRVQTKIEVFGATAPQLARRSWSSVYVNRCMSRGLDGDNLCRAQVIMWSAVCHLCFLSCSALTHQFSSDSRSVVSNSLRPHEPQHTRPPCPSPTPGVHPNPCPSSQWCHPTISSSVVPFSSCPPSFPASGSFPMSQLFASGGQSIALTHTSLLFAGGPHPQGYLPPLLTPDQN